MTTAFSLCRPRHEDFFCFGSKKKKKKWLLGNIPEWYDDWKTKCAKRYYNVLLVHHVAPMHLFSVVRSKSTPKEGCAHNTFQMDQPDSCILLLAYSYSLFGGHYIVYTLSLGNTCYTIHHFWCSLSVRLLFDTEFHLCTWMWPLVVVALIIFFFKYLSDFQAVDS